MAENRRIEQIADRLADEYVSEEGESAQHEHVADVVAEAAAPLEDAPVQDFVPLLVENAARDRMHQEGMHIEPADDDTAPAHVAADDDHEPMVSGFAQADVERR
jgi:hypothetical protein